MTASGGSAEIALKSILYATDFSPIAEKAAEQVTHHRIVIDDQH